MMKNLVFILLISIVVFAGCKDRGSEGSKMLSEKIKSVTTALYETDPVNERISEDAADDPAIWINPDSIEQSKIIGTDKKGGLAVYNLKGDELFYYPVGYMNNVDVRYGFPLNGDTVDIVVASNRTYKSISIYSIASNGALTDIAARVIKSQMASDVYGFCLYHNPASNKFYAYVNSKVGEIEQWELFANLNSKIDAKLVRSFSLAGQVEGMVADDENNIIFIGEENGGIWKFNAEPDGGSSGKLIDKSSESNNEFIVYDIEGLSIYYLPNGLGYLIASSQGNYSYAVYNRRAPHEYLGSFRIVDGVIDGLEETDGIDIYSYYLNEDFQHGIFIAQDGYNTDNEKSLPQNFKLVPWENIAKLFPDTLEIN